MKRCSTSLIIEEIQIKTTVSTTSHQLEWPPLKSLQITNAGEGVKKKEPSLHCCECKSVHTPSKAFCISKESEYDEAGSMVEIVNDF